MLRLITKKNRRNARRSQNVARIQQTESPLENRRVLSAISAAADVHDASAGTNATGSVELESASQQGATARIVNGQSTSDYEAVGVVNNGCTGTLIAPDIVLTAAHCVEADGGGYIGDTEGTFETNGTVYRTTKITVHPNYNPNDFGAGYDISIMKLERAAEGVVPHDINRMAPAVGQTLTLVGFGETGTSTSGSNGDFGNKTVGQTDIDAVTETHIAWNFDSHDESNTAPGDSGGPAFLEVNGKLVVAGITSGGDGDPHSLGDYSFDTRVDTLASWIDQVAGTTGDTGGGGDDGGGSDDGEGGGGDTGGGGAANSGTFTSGGSVAIPGNNVATVTSTADVSGLDGKVTDVNVTLNIQHTWNEDLTVTLISPSGTRIELFDAVGGDNDNFVNTVLDQQAAGDIEDGAAPFTGTYRPFDDLSQLNGEDPNGTWTLEVQDHFEEDGGQITSFSVTITTDAQGGNSDGGGGDNPGGPNDLAQLAIDIDRQWDLDTSGNYFENWGGRNEKWMTSNAGWLFITPDGALYEWTGSGANGDLVATFSPEYHASPELLHDAYNNSLNSSPTALAAKAIEIDQEYEVRTTGNLWEDWSGQGEKWLYSNVGWVFLTPDGSLFQASGNDDGSDRLVYKFSAEYHEDVTLLYNAYDNAIRDKRDSDNLFASIGDSDLLCSI